MHESGKKVCNSEYKRNLLRLGKNLPSAEMQTCAGKSKLSSLVASSSDFDNRKEAHLHRKGNHS